MCWNWVKNEFVSSPSTVAFFWEASGLAIPISLELEIYGGKSESYVKRHTLS